ncbi:MAG: potassium-transporting ATPase subunit A, partial [Fibrella sp.]|nr:potassium-transporting ATPase subunit A [Armatimonadota bacterium]
LALVALGVPMNWSPYVPVTTLEGATQVLPGGPVAALEFIKNLGTNGGGFFNVNGAHPYECPSPIANLIEMLAIAVLPASLTYTLGKMLNRPRLGWMLFAVMTVLFVGGLIVCGAAEQTGNPQIAALGVTGGNFEGKETRFGIGGSVLAAITTSNGATGSYNSMYDSYTPLGGGVLLVNMLLGEIVYGGLGTGVYSIVMITLVGLFLSGLMIGRTPEFVGKMIGPPEIKLVMLYTLATPAAVLLLTAIAVVTEGGLAGLTTNNGSHGFSEIIYAYASATANNGQNMAGLSANTPFYNITTAIAMMIGRFGLAIPALALAGHLATQGRRPTTLGTLPTDTVQFAVVLLGTALIVGALSFFPALALGPIVEHFQMIEKR